MKLSNIKSFAKKPIVLFFSGLLIAVLVGWSIFGGSGDGDTVDNNTAKSVQVATPATLGNEGTFSLIGNVRAASEATITAESAKRVTSVNTSLGNRVSAGEILITLENSSERAAVLQAEGVYEAAVASAEQSGLSVSEAENNLSAARRSAINSLRGSYNSVFTIVVNDIDDFFSTPTLYPGLKLTGYGQTDLLNSTRIEYQTLLPQWKNRTDTLTTNSNLQAETEYAIARLNKTVNFLELFIPLFSRQDNSRYTDTELQNFTANFSNQRASLLTLINTLESNLTAVENAEEALQKARIAASGGRTSAADAQIKQALGSLRSAQANLGKTILRAPISGTVNQLDVRVGDFATAFATLALIANNNALEIITYVGENERNQIEIGDTVLIDNQYEGVITQIAPAVDAITRKTEVRIATESTEITAGDTVRINKEFVTEEAEDGPIIIPITAVKFEAENGYIFQIENNVLVKKEVVLGSVFGSQIEITEGMQSDTEFVVDARGLVTGQTVEIAN